MEDILRRNLKPDIPSRQIRQKIRVQDSIKGGHQIVFAKLMKKIVLLTAFAATVGLAHADSPGFYRLTTEIKFMTCGLMQNLAADHPHHQAAYEECVSSGIKESKAQYEKVVAQSGKKTALKLALKEYQFRVIGGLKGLEPVGDESQGAYKSRQITQKIKLDEAWTRVEMEQ